MKTINIMAFIFIINFASAAEFTLNSDPKFIPDFKNRFSVLAGVNPSMTKTNQITNVHLSYAKNQSDNFWLDYNFTLTNAYLNQITTNNSSATTLTNTQFTDSTGSTQASLGIGFQYETKYVQGIIPFEGMYELIGASLTYNMFKDPLAAKTFTGPGIIAKYSVLKKFSDFVSIGGNFIYNLAVVKRSQLNSNETSSSRSLTLTHLTLGLDLSFYL